MKIKFSIFYFPLSIFLLSGCLLGPDYQRPETPQPAHWMNEESADAADLARWWEHFNDPVLTNLITRALDANLDLLQAAERVRQARAVLIQTGGALYPTIDASGSTSRRYNSNTGWSSLHSVGLDAAWEFDIFGGNRRAIEATEYDYAASVAAQRGVRVALAAEVARAYFTLHLQNQILRVTFENIALQTKSARIASDRHAAGWVSALDVANAEGQLNTTRAQIPPTIAEMASAVLALEFLLAKLPGTLVAELEPLLWEVVDTHAPKTIFTQPLRSDGPFFNDDISKGLPSELLQRRPDIQRAEAQLAAATARIGVAEADRFPKIRILAGAGLTAPQLNDWARTLSLTPGVSVPLFNAGRLRARVEERRAFAQEKLYAYQQTVLAAFSEVEDFWQAYLREGERTEPLEAAFEQYAKAHQIATGLYEAGEADFTEVLLAQRSLLTSEEALVRNRHLTAQRLVALYKALGGGWEE